MYSINEAPVFQLAFDLLKDFHLIRAKFPKAEKYTLGSKIEETVLNMLVSIIEAGNAKREFKIAPIKQAILKNNLLKVLFRLAFEIKIITEKQYLDFEERLQKIGQMLGGWQRSL